MEINLSLEEQTKAIRIEGPAQIQAEAWLFDAAHNAENVGMVEQPSNEITIPAQSVTLYVIQE